MNNETIRHMVIFCLHAGKDNAQADTFLKESAEELSTIPGVERFEVFRQVSVKNDYDYGFSMEFRDQAAYMAYNENPVHKRYVETRWQNEVSRFLEIDFKQ